MKLFINDQPIEATAGQTILEAAAQHGIEIPALCHHRDLTPVGSCRLCLVEISGVHGPVASCTQPVNEGMVVHTETAPLIEERKAILEMLLADYSDTSIDKSREETEFEHWVRLYKVERPEWARGESQFPVDGDPNPFVSVDLNKCILCTRCVRACDEIQGCFVWGVSDRGRDTKLIAGADTSMLEAGCESCGACAAFCPTGALDDRMRWGLGQSDKKVTTTCCYCGVGCQFDLNVKDDRIIGVTSNPDAPVNGMSLCVKGRYGYDFIDHQDRLLKPRVREYLLSRCNRDTTDRGKWVEVDWNTALNLVAEKLNVIRETSGPDAIGFLSSAKCSNEENYLMQKLARQVIGTHNIDHCARLCHSSTVAGLSMCFGSGAMTNSMADIANEAEALFIIGSNTTEQHPVFGAMIRQAVLKRNLKLVVADPRKIAITEFAKMHLQQRPGTDVALINGLMYLILEQGRQDEIFIRERCEGFDEFRDALVNYPPAVVAEITGVPVDQLQQAADLLGRHKPMAVLFAMGITQHTTGVLNVLSLGNLQMLLGNIGIPGGGVNPLRGQNNVQGACDMGALVNVFPGYQPVANSDVLAKFDSAWALEPAVFNSEGTTHLGLSNQPGLTVVEMMEAAKAGRVRGLYILGENPAVTDPDSNHVQECLEKAEFVVLHEIFPSETSRYADVILPGTTFAERTGTFTNTERRIQLFHQAITPRGETRPEADVICDLARRILAQQGRLPTGPYATWNDENVASILEEVSQLTPSYAGVSYNRLERGEQLQWPVLDLDHPGTPILHVDQFTRGKGRFHAVDHLPAKELPDEEYPFLMTTGRVLYHWHAGEMTRRGRGLSEVYPESLMEISPEDALRLGIKDNQTIHVRSRRGRTSARAAVTPRVSPGLLFANFHFPGERNINNVTIAALDPISKIPEYKVCAVQIET